VKRDAILLCVRGLTFIEINRYVISPERFKNKKRSFEQANP
jgi:hypothetical protein